MIKLLVLFSLITVSPGQSLTGYWILPNHPDVQIAMLEGKGKLEAIVIVNPKCKKKILTPFYGKVDRKKDEIDFSASSRVLKLTDKCTVEFTLMGYGRMKSGSVREFSVQCAMVSFVKCTDKSTKTNVDDLSGKWLYFQKKGKSVSI